jgi:hypothetical protein
MVNSMKNIILTSLIFLQACAPASSSSPTAADSKVAQPVVAPATNDCSADPLIGTWQSQTNAAEIWRFNADCTGVNQLCSQTFTWPSTHSYNFLITHTSGQTTGPECMPTDNIVKPNRTINANFLNGPLQISGNYHGAWYFNKIAP